MFKPFLTTAFAFCLLTFAAHAQDAPAQPDAGAWLRADQLALQQQVQQVQLRSASGSTAQDDSQTWLPVVQEFKALIDNDPELYMLFTQMFEQIPRTPQYQNDPVGNQQVRHYRDMLISINN